MHPLFTPESWNERPAMRVLVLAWAAAAAQTPIAGWAWLSCFAFGLMATRIGTRPEEALPPARALRDNIPTPDRPLARRRTDAAVSARHEPPPALPTLKAHRDALTGLATPQQLDDTGQAWSQDLQARGLSLCVLHVGLEGLDPVVERYGQEAGDQVLQQVAKRLRQLARDEDRVMRFDGAEFVLLLACPQAEGESFTRRMAERIGAELQRPLAYRTVSKLQVGCDVGSAVWPQHAETLELVIDRAAQSLAAARSRRLAVLQPEPA
jgi:diguanylate cyclase (GGDEF)-like protein